MQGSQPPDAFMAQRNTPYAGNYDRMPVFDPSYHQQRVGLSYVDGALASTSGSSSSASHNAIPSMAQPPNGRRDPSTPPRTMWPPNHPHDADQGNTLPGSTSRFTDVRTRTNVNPPVHYRTNFGKNCSYFPPATKSSPGRLPPDVPVAPHRDLPPSPKRLPPAVLENIARARSRVFSEGRKDAHENVYAVQPDATGRFGNVYPPVAKTNWEEDDMPFDQQRDLYRPPTANNHPSTGITRNFNESLEVQQETPPMARSQSDWDQSSPNRPVPLRTYYSEPDDSMTGRFQISPPRVTDPTPLHHQMRTEVELMMAHDVYPPITAAYQSHGNNYPPATTSSHAPANHFFAHPVINSETGYDSMEAECSPNRTVESTSLYSPYSQATRGSHFKWPDDSPRSKTLESPTSTSRQVDAPVLQSPTRLRSPVKVGSPRFGSLSHPELIEEDFQAENYQSRQVEVIPSQLESGSQYYAEEPDAFFESHQPDPLIAHPLPKVQEPHYPSLVSDSFESESQDPSDQGSPSATIGEHDPLAAEPLDVPLDSGRNSTPPVVKISVENQNEVEGSWDETGDDFPDPEDELPSSTAGDETSPLSLRKKNSLQTDDDSIFQFTDDDQQGKQLSPSEQVISPKHDQSRKKGHSAVQRRGRRRATSESEGPEDDDDTSLENAYGGVPKRSSSLQERTQQAWASRKSAAVHRPHSISIKPGSVPVVEAETTSVPGQYDEDEITALTGGTGITGDPSFGGSLNSLYTKTIESEVEDAIKDLLLIGTGRATNPGRRPNNFQLDNKQTLKDGEDNSSVLEDEATEFTPLDDETEDMDDFREEKKEGDNPIQLMWEYMEGNLSVLGSAFGLSPEAKAEAKSKLKNQGGSASAEEGTSFSPKANSGVRDRDRKSRNKTRSKPRNYDYGEEVAHDTRISNPRSRDFGDERKRDTRPRLTEKRVHLSEPEPVIAARSTEIAEEDVELEDSTIGGTVTYSFQAVSVCDSAQSEDHDAEASDHDAEASRLSSPAALQTVSKSVTAPMMPAPLSRNAKLEDDPRLIELALEAARSLHQLAGVQFDDSNGIDIVEDIKFSIVKLSLPLGILFQENSGGCWVTRILPSGNAAKVGRVELGDQLAAVNGVSAIKAKVDEVCTLVSEASDPSSVELTFLRYVGPLRSLPVESEDEDEFPAAIDELKQRDHRQTENVFSCVIGGMRDETTAQTEPDERSRPEEKPRQELSELQPSRMVPPVKTNSKQKDTEGKKRFRFFGLGRKKNATPTK